jgi:hypothetical protein
MPKTVPYFGQIFRNLKYGFKWCADLRLFVRITQMASESPLYQIEIQPPTFDCNIPIVGQLYTEYTLWHSQEGIIAMIPALNKYQSRTKPLIFYVDADGQEILDRNRDRSESSVQVDTTVETTVTFVESQEKPGDPDGFNPAMMK